ncbi:MAG: hypothetical protein JF584_10425, partial [Acidobacteria bacterium]|nr:hypothetical protein [Acidobacteriota bacterium]
VQSTECRKLYDKLDVAIRDVMDKNLIMEGLKLATDGLSFLFSFQKTLIAKSTKDLRGVNVTPMPGDGSSDPGPADPGSAPATMDDTGFDTDSSSDAGGSSSGDKTEEKTPLLTPGPQTPEQLFDEQNLQKQKSALAVALKKYGLQVLQMAAAFAKILQGTGADDAMIGKAHGLLLDQQKLTTILIEAARSWEKALWSDVEVPDFPETLNAHRIDPGQKWDDFLREADVSPI